MDLVNELRHISIPVATDTTRIPLPVRVEITKLWIHVIHAVRLEHLTNIFWQFRLQDLLRHNYQS
jgi:hypothetical protein